MPERPKGADCKSAGYRLRRFESFSRHGVTSLREIAFSNMSLGGVRGGRLRRSPLGSGRSGLPVCPGKVAAERPDRHESRLASTKNRPATRRVGGRICCLLSSVAEHFHGKEGVPGSNPGGGSDGARRRRCRLWALRPQPTAHGPTRRSSSVGESARLIIERSAVQVRPPLRTSRETVSEGHPEASRRATSWRKRSSSGRSRM